MIKPVTLTFGLAVVAMLHATAQGEDSILVDEMVVVLIDAVDVPASQSGVIADISVKEGESVSFGSPLAKLDDRKSQLLESQARTQLAIATENAEHGMEEDLAKKKLDEQRQLAKEHEFKREIAERKASNEVRVLASQKAERVAKNELDRASRARQEFVDSVSQSEIDGLRFAYERTSLETEQAGFERRIAALEAKAEAEVASGHQLGIERLTIEVAQAEAKQRVQAFEVELQRQQMKLATLATEQQRILSPFDGVVVERFRNRGDWVNAGDPVIRVIRLNRLRAEGFLEADKIGSLRSEQPVALTIQRGVQGVIEREGVIAFISPEIDPINGQVRIWVEFDNPDLEILPGMRLSLRLMP
ncbi:MAG: HlyD family secretion protein [Rubripirellula sp.]